MESPLAGKSVSDLNPPLPVGNYEGVISKKLNDIQETIEYDVKDKDTGEPTGERDSFDRHVSRFVFKVNEVVTEDTEDLWDAYKELKNTDEFIFEVDHFNGQQASQFARALDEDEPLKAIEESEGERVRVQVRTWEKNGYTNYGYNFSKAQS